MLLRKSLKRSSCLFSDHSNWAELNDNYFFGFQLKYFVFLHDMCRFLFDLNSFLYIFILLMWVFIHWSGAIEARDKNLAIWYVILYRIYNSIYCDTLKNIFYKCINISSHHYWSLRLSQNPKNISLAILHKTFRIKSSSVWCSFTKSVNRVQGVTRRCVSLAC